ncbi:MAG: hydantoinase/oxoprolinase family protein [Gammaproteobacteria bacterium]|nr:hydantoinase/oxoprolinase family protein [Gammaproteobacteria bacterium]
MQNDSDADHGVLIGVDTGGTFTDFIMVDEAGRLQTLKRLSTPDDPARAIVDGLRELGLAQQRCRMVHGTTVATNAVLEGEFARTAFITNRGFADLLTLARQNRPQIYTLTPEVQAPPVPAELCLEVAVRCDADGRVLVDDLDAAALARLREQLSALQVEAVAVCLLFSWRNDDHEQRLAQHLGELWPVSCSAQLVPEIGEYERGIACWLNAALTPVISAYLGRLQQQLPQANIAIMQSSGQTMAAAQAALEPVRLLLSGPAGGLAAVAAIRGHASVNVATEAHHAGLLSFDMGGTSTDVAVVLDRPLLTSRGRVDRWPVALPMIEMHTIGAGGGSIAWLDAAGALQVGPQSAGADPGPACYQQGGTQPTVTDAHVVLGHLPADTQLGGYLPLSREHAEQAFADLAARLGQDVDSVARDVLRLVDEHMARALQLMSAQRGHDPARMQLVSFGGAGGLHVCSLAARLGMQRAMVPMHAGVLSALGMLLAPAGRELTHSMLQPLAQVSDARIETALQALSQRARDELQREGVDVRQLDIRPQLDCSYRGQKDSISISWDPAQSRQQLAEQFHRQHEQLNGHRLDLDIMLVNARISATAGAALGQLPRWQPDADGNGAQRQSSVRLTAGTSTPVDVHDRSVLARQTVRGPAIIMDDQATLWLEIGWQASADEHGNVLLQRE